MSDRGAKPGHWRASKEAKRDLGVSRGGVLTREMGYPGQRLVEAVHRPKAHLREVGADLVGHEGTVGAELAEARQLQGLDLHTIAEELRIRYDYLEALEEGRVDDLPAPVYVVGFLRNYAGYLDLEVEDCVSRFKAEVSNFGAKPKLAFPSPAEDGRLPTRPLLVVAAMLAVAAYAGWYGVTYGDRVAIDEVPEVPAKLAERVAFLPEPLLTDSAGGSAARPAADDVAVEPIEPATAQTDNGEGEPIAAGDVAEPDPASSAMQPAPGTIPVAMASTAGEPASTASVSIQTESERAVASDASEPTQRESVATTASTSSESESAAVSTQANPSLVPPPPVATIGYVPRVFGQGNTDARIEVHAVKESWVQVMGLNDELLLTRILRPGDVYIVPNRAGLMLMTGNAGGLAITVDGRPVPPLGPVGAVRRNVVLDPERLLVGDAFAR